MSGLTLWRYIAIGTSAALGSANAGCDAKPEEASEEPQEKVTAPAPQAPLGPGDTAPDVKGLSHIGYMVSLGNFQPGPIVVYYCPALDTACEQLATRLRDDWLELTPHITMALVFTPFGMHENREFATKLELPQLVVSDHTGEALAQLGMIRAPGALPSAYLLDDGLEVLRVFDNPWQPNHIEELEAALEQASSGQ